MYTGRMTHDELERFYYITNDPRHAALVSAEENLASDEVSTLEDRIADLQREAEETDDEVMAALDERDKMQDERDDAVKERERLRAENNAQVVEILRMREALSWA
jgi:septal ring factor EnvC (AmiA/AmiB activator)